MKKFFCRTSIIIPLMFIYMFRIMNITLSITEIDLYLDPYSTQNLFIGIIMIWLCCSPFRKSCCNGGLTEVLFYLIPIEAILLLIFAQHHFKIAVFMILGLLVLIIRLLLVLQKDTLKKGRTESIRRQNRRTFMRAALWVITAVCAVPCLMALFKYNLRPPTYKPRERLWDTLLAKDDSGEAPDTEDPYENHIELLRHFEQNRWDTRQIEEKITLVQGLVDFEAEKFGIPTTPVTSQKLAPYTLGQYSDETGEMWIDVQVLDTSPPQEILETVCHEFYHHLQYYLTGNIDWENPAMNSSYFAELKSWKENQGNYKQAWVDGFQAYENQSLEASARAYAEEETEKILSYIEESEKTK